MNVEDTSMSAISQSIMSTVASVSSKNGDGDDGAAPYNQKSSRSPPPQHRRGYQACDACRKRKVKCDQGSIDNPNPPPCARCRREGKRCEFSATRRKRKLVDLSDGDGVLRRDERMMYGESPQPQQSISTATSVDHEQGNRRTLAWPAAEHVTPSNGLSSTTMPTATPVKSETQDPPSQRHFTSSQIPRAPPSSRMYATGRKASLPAALPGQKGHYVNEAATRLLSSAVSNSPDVLQEVANIAGHSNKLMKAKGCSSSTESSLNQPASSQQQTRNNSLAASSIQQSGGSGMSAKDAASEGEQHGISTGPVTPTRALSDVDYMRAQRVWSRLRFIRAGWFTADEAMSYVFYYYQYLAPLSPIVIPDFRSPSTHYRLLAEEPVLAITILTIASRFMKLTGNGAPSRQIAIHDKLWSYLHTMVERLFWGQEGSGNNNRWNRRRDQNAHPPANWTYRSGPLRTLGTVEALLLLTDWHPRSLYFPPGDDENALLDADPEFFHNDMNDGLESSTNKSVNENVEGQSVLQHWLEPVYRSDRMSWMLLSTAQALAFELGVFDTPKASQADENQRRKCRVRRLILVYVSQISGRLGIPSMLPLSQWNIEADVGVANKYSGDGSDPAEEAIDQMQECWMEISRIMYRSNKEMFLTKETTSQLVKSGRYRDKINEYMPLLRDFKRKVDNLATLQPPMRHVLMLEHEYTRLYINCMALQAVVDSWTAMANQDLNPNPDAKKQSSSRKVLAEQSEANQSYIKEVIDASRSILRIVLDGLVPGDHLKHSPMRTFFRTLSGMLFILKTFMVGAKEDDVLTSLDLQDRTIEVLRTKVADDIHVGVTISELMELTTQHVRRKFIRFAPANGAGADGSVDDGSAAVTAAQSPRPQEQSPPKPVQGGNENHARFVDTQQPKPDLNTTEAPSQFSQTPLQPQQQQQPQYQQKQQFLSPYQQQPHPTTSTTINRIDPNMPTYHLDAPPEDGTYIPPPFNLNSDYFTPNLNTVLPSPAQQQQQQQPANPMPHSLEQYDPGTLGTAGSLDGMAPNPATAAAAAAAEVAAAQAQAQAQANGWLVLRPDIPQTTSVGVDQGLGTSIGLEGGQDVLDLFFPGPVFGGGPDMLP